MAEPIQVKYAGYTHNFPPDATEAEISSALEEWEKTPRTPIGVANQELNRIRPGMQVSGREMNPRALAQRTPVEYAGGGGKLAGVTEGVLSEIPKIGESLIAPRQGDYGDELLNMGKSIIGLPKAAGEHIGNAVNAFRSNEPYTAGQEGTEGAMDTAAALGAARPLSEGAPGMIRGGAKAINAGIRNAPQIGMGAGLIGGIGESIRGSPSGILWMPYLGGRIGKMIKENVPEIPGERFGLPEPTPAFAGGGLQPATGPERAPGVGGRPPVGPATLPRLGVEPRGGPIAPPTSPVAASPRPVETGPPGVPSEDAVAQGMGLRNAQQAVQRFGPEKWRGHYDAVIGGLQKPSAASVGPIGKPTPFDQADYEPWGGRFAENDLERAGERAAKEKFYEQAPQVKTKTQLVNEAQPGAKTEKPKPSIVAKSEKKK